MSDEDIRVGALTTMMSKRLNGSRDSMLAPIS
jgi:hypothetical protein